MLVAKKRQNYDTTEISYKYEYIIMCHIFYFSHYTMYDEYFSFQNVVQCAYFIESGVNVSL